VIGARQRRSKLTRWSNVEVRYQTCDIRHAKKHALSRWELIKLDGDSCTGYDTFTVRNTRNRYLVYSSNNGATRSYRGSGMISVDTPVTGSRDSARLIDDTITSPIPTFKSSDVLFKRHIN
jgi:hypothetical protein